MQSGSVEHRIALTRTTQQRGQHDDQRKPESSRQEHQAGGIDGKFPTELLVVTLSYEAALVNQKKSKRGCWRKGAPQLASLARQAGPCNPGLQLARYKL